MEFLLEEVIEVYYYEWHGGGSDTFYLKPHPTCRIGGIPRENISTLPDKENGVTIDYDVLTSSKDLILNDLWRASVVENILWIELC